MIKIEALGYIIADAVVKQTPPPQQKEYAFFVIKTTDDKGIHSLVKCYYYGCSVRKIKALKSGCKVLVWGKLNLSLFTKDTGENEININLNVTDLIFV